MNGIIAIRKQIVDLLNGALEQAVAAGDIPPLTVDIVLEHPQKIGFGDYASSLPLKLARASGLKPMDIAQTLVSRIPACPELASVSVAPPGFINFTLSPGWLCGLVEHVLASPDSYGEVAIGDGSRVQIEFVSANPTGPVHVGHGRGAVLGSTLANVLSAAGYNVQKEFYVNDAGSQVEAFRRSLYARYQQALGAPGDIPADGYHGSYLVDMAAEMVESESKRFLTMPPAEAAWELGELGVARMLEEIKTDLTALGVDFDVWFSERTLYEKGQYQTAMTCLRDGGFVAERENATWFTGSNLGESKDNVIIRSDGSPTYFASDIAYHYNKFVERGFDTVIDVWGADHQGHVPRMKAVLMALNIDPDRLKVILFQMITLRRGGEMVRLSKRTGDIITLREVIDEVGADACRFFFLSRATDSQMDFDLELAKKQSAENPVYYVQYAHARIASILRLAEERQLDMAGGDAALLGAPAELGLLRRMMLLPEIVETVAQTLEPHHLTYYAQELATAFHLFYKDCRVVSDDVAMSKARLKLVAAAKIVLGRTLKLMGMTAPDSM